MLYILNTSPRFIWWFMGSAMEVWASLGSGVWLWGKYLMNYGAGLSCDYKRTWQGLCMCCCSSSLGLWATSVELGGPDLGMYQSQSEEGWDQLTSCSWDKQEQGGWGAVSYKCSCLSVLLRLPLFGKDIPRVYSWEPGSACAPFCAWGPSHTFSQKFSLLP